MYIYICIYIFIYYICTSYSGAGAPPSTQAADTQRPYPIDEAAERHPSQHAHWCMRKIENT